MTSDSTTEAANDPSENVYADVWSRIKDIRYAMLTTLDDDDTLVARPMTTVQKEFSGSLWFFASRSMPPALSVELDGTVGVQYTDHGSDTYVSLSGDASLEHDRARMEALWSPMTKAWFPKGLDDPDLVMIRVDVHKAEYWDTKESKPVQLFKMAKAAVTGVPPKMGEHKTIEM